ncbi:hypothetical protein [Streptomyces sp.]|uniref:hypothetical protein n=1 Tax=Streptomyces sp. TaxID=1931 RepID=UPI002F3EB66A
MMPVEGDAEGVRRTASEHGGAAAGRVARAAAARRQAVATVPTAAGTEPGAARGEGTAGTDSVRGSEPVTGAEAASATGPVPGADPAPGAAESVTSRLRALRPRLAAARSSEESAAASRDADRDEGRRAGAAGTAAAARGTAGSASPGTAAAAGGAEPPADEPASAFGRPKKPMLAAAAMVGAVLLAVPFLMAGGDDEERNPRTGTVAQDTLLSDGDGPHADGVFVPEDPPEDSTSAPSAPVLVKKTRPATVPGGPGGPYVLSRNKPEPKPEELPPPPSLRKERQEQAPQPTVSPKAAPPQPVSKDTTAPYWESTRRHVANGHTGKCLATIDSGRMVGQGDCGSAPTWQRFVVGDGTFLLRITSTNNCLDSNGETPYVSPCTVKDAGQLWRMSWVDTCAVTLVSPKYTEYLTGWNAGTVSVVDPGTADVPAKHNWAISTAAGC